MYKGEKIDGLDFYNLLFDSLEFTSELGKVTLSAGKLEAELIKLLINNNVKENIQKATLGSLINKCAEKKICEKNLINVLKLVCLQRNYLTHNIYALFNNQINETILPKSKLIDTDVISYTDKAMQLSENLNNLTEIIKGLKTN